MNIALADTLATLPVAPAAPAAPVVIQPLDTPAAEVMVPIVFFLVIFGTVLVNLLFKERMRRLMQQERLRAMELRLPIPPEARRTRGNPFVMPLMMVGVGLALLVLWLNVKSDDRVVAMAFGMISLLSGLGWLAALRLNRESRLREEQLAEQESRAYVEAMGRLQAMSPADSPTAPEPPTPAEPRTPPGF